MSSFAGDWLALREPYDHAARAKGLLGALGQWAAGCQRLHIADLGSGTGSNLRGTSPALGSAQDWTLLEHDPRLIETGTALLGGLDHGITARYRPADLSVDLAAVIPDDTELVTCAAFLDLVSAAWLDRLVALVGQRRTALYVALTYDGGWRWRPGDIFDAEIKRLFDAHQASDKGFGPALGPRATTALIERLEPMGGRLMVEASDWRLGYADQAIQDALLEGYASAARELAADQADEIGDWRTHRQKYVSTGRSGHRVGHKDLLWLPD